MQVLCETLFFLATFLLHRTVFLWYPRAWTFTVAINLLACKSTRRCLQGSIKHDMLYTPFTLLLHVNRVYSLLKNNTLLWPLLQFTLYSVATLPLTSFLQLCWLAVNESFGPHRAALWLPCSVSGPLLIDTDVARQALLNFKGTVLHPRQQD